MKITELKAIIKECLTEMAEISITSLDKSARIFAKQLEAKGYTVKVTTLKSGRGSQEIGPSTVELDINKGHDWVCTVEFVSGGYYSGGSKHGKFGGDSWSNMKSAAMEYIKRNDR